MFKKTYHQTPAQMKKDSEVYGLSLSLAGQLGYLIAIPAVALGFGGAYMDKYFQTSPMYMLLGLFIALVLSSIAVYRKVKLIISSYPPA